MSVPKSTASDFRISEAVAVANPGSRHRLLPQKSRINDQLHSATSTLALHNAEECNRTYGGQGESDEPWRWLRLRSARSPEAPSKPR